MINLAVINIKDIINFIKKIMITFIIFFFFLKFMWKIKDDNYVKIEDLKEKSVIDFCEIIDQTLVISKYYNENEKIINKSGIKKILASELSILDIEEKLMELENQEEVIEFESVEEVFKEIPVQNIDEIKEEKNEVKAIEENLLLLPTKVIEENNKKDTYTDIYKSVKIKNESKYEMNETILKPDFDLLNKKDIIIYHTHTCESYTPTNENNYEPSGNFRSIDSNYNVSRVGQELANNLMQFFSVNHNKTYHDYPAYSGSYNRSLATIKNLLPENYSGLVIDLHRDALGNNSKYAPKVQIGDEIAAQLMFVIGTDGGGLTHLNWKRNLKTAIKIQEKANEIYPGLFKPIILRNSRYNQHVSDGACIIEVGATGNTLEECNVSMKYLAKVLEEVLLK